MDACVLYPPTLRDLFLWLAVEKVFQPQWTETIHTEWIENLLRQRPTLNRAALLRTRDLMNQYGGDCLVTNDDALIERLTLPDPNDRHILAAAITGRADTIVTFNLRDFPAATLRLYGITALAPDPFVCGLYAVRPEAVLSAARQMHHALRKPPKTRDQFLSSLRTNQLTRFADLVEEWF